MIISSEALNKFETKRNDRIGERHGALTIKEYLSRKDGYLVECDCGNTLSVKYYRLQRGVTRSCRECFVSKSAGRPVLPDSLGAKRAVMTQYRIEAKRRGLEFSLSEVDFCSLIVKDCTYCGVRPSTKITITTSSAHDDFRYNGVDRVDSSKGYTTDNCVTCCKQCNFAKLDYDLASWLTWVERIYKFQKEKGTFND